MSYKNNPLWREQLGVISFGLAIFFSCFSSVVGIFFLYPVPELVALVFLCVSAVNFSVLALVPVLAGALLLAGDSYFYYSLTLILAPFACILGINRLSMYLQFRSIRRVIKLSLWISVLAMLVQYFAPTALPDIDYITLGTGARAAGFKQEPSHAIILVVLYLTISFTSDNKFYRREVLISYAFSLIIFYLTKSELVAIVWLTYFAFSQAARVPRFLILVCLIMLASVLVRFSGFIGEFLLMEMGSWRSVPDITMIANFENFLWPNFQDSQDIIQEQISIRSYSDSYIRWTYSYFGNLILTLGYVPTFVGVSLFWVFKRRAFKGVYDPKAIPLLLGAFFLIPKYEVLCITLMIGAYYIRRQSVAFHLGKFSASS